MHMYTVLVSIFIWNVKTHLQF